VVRSVSSTQVNFQIPPGISPGPATVVVSADLQDSAPYTIQIRPQSNPPLAAFFTGEVNLGSNVEYLQFPDNLVFGYYTFVAGTIFYHYDMGYEAFIAGSSGTDIYLFDFTSGHWWYTNASTFPYLYDFTLNSWIYYFPNTSSPGHYTTNPRYFSNLTTGQIITM